jgi:hypothetical protein
LAVFVKYAGLAGAVSRGYVFVIHLLFLFLFLLHMDFH